MFILPELQYAYDALEPSIDKETMTIHHTKHHQGYTNKCNAALEWTALEWKDIEYILTHLDEAPADKFQAIKNNAWWYYNHKLFRESMGPNCWGQPEGSLAESINESFWDFENFKEAFSAKAKTVFWSGWAWLCKDAEGKLCLKRSSAQDNPLSKWLTPLLGIDVWEHAYYINYQNKRPDYIKARWDVVNRKEVEKRFDS